MIIIYFNNNSFLIDAIEIPLQNFFLNKLAGWSLLTLLKKTPRHRRFPANFSKILKTRHCRTLENSCFWNLIMKFQKQPPRGVPRKRCCENMQQIYRRATMLKFHFNKVAKQLYWNRTSAWLSPVNLLHIFRTPFPENTSERLLLKLLKICNLVMCIQKF